MRKSLIIFFIVLSPLISAQELKTFFNGQVANAEDINTNFQSLKDVVNEINTGAILLSGEGAPSDSIGKDGDFYVDFANYALFGPKTGNGWSEGDSLVGPAGTYGLRGELGPQGEQGSTGLTGAQGEQGPIGLTGTSGLAGSNGSDGATGAQGPQGDTGSTGAQGIQGDTGAVGAEGPTGPAGANGAVGATGAQGDTGSTGAQGIQGDTGAAGAEGATGPVGANGAVGATGAQGSQGDSGATGAQGIQGDTGAAGAEGATGPAGVDGSDGATGAQGASGVAGSVTQLTDALVENNSIYLGNDPSSTTSTAENNIAVGTTALGSITTGDANVAIGDSALTANTTGWGNAGIGDSALSSNVFGRNNTAVGYNASKSSNEHANSAFGAHALEDSVTGIGNTGIGYEALKENITGSNNVALGSAALDTNTSGASNTAIGAAADVGSNNLDNATAIGNGAIVSDSNTMQLGNDAVTNVKTSGSITAGEITIPNTDGSANQVLKTNGSGTLFWGSAGTGFSPVPYNMLNSTGSVGNPNRTIYTQLYSPKTMTISKITIWGENNGGSTTILAGIYRGEMGSNSTSGGTLIGQGSKASEDGLNEITILPEPGQNLSISELDPIILGIHISDPSYWNPYLFCNEKERLYLTRRQYIEKSTMPAAPDAIAGYGCQYVSYVR